MNVWINEIDKQHARIDNLDVVQSKAEFLKICQLWPCFGASVYTICAPVNEY
jgi:hypothetical protein